MKELISGELLNGNIVEIEPSQAVAEEAIESIAGLTAAEKNMLKSLIGLFRERKENK